MPATPNAEREDGEIRVAAVGLSLGPLTQLAFCPVFFTLGASKLSRFRGFSVMLPEHAPEACSDRENLWNAVEAVEVRKDAQLAREVEFAIPCEVSEAQGIALARDFVRSAFVDQGMVADLSVHWDGGEAGILKPHAQRQRRCKTLPLGRSKRRPVSASTLRPVWP